MSTDIGAGNRADQTELVMRYVARVLGAAGACFDDVLKLNTYHCHRVGAGALRDGADPRCRCFSPPGPASSDMLVDELAYAGMLVEVEAIAARGRATVSRASRLPCSARCSAIRLENGAGAVLVADTTLDTAEVRTAVTGATPDSGVSVITLAEHATLRFRPHPV